MEQNRKEFLQGVCNLYLVGLLVVVPLYTGEGYWRLGDSKYLIFRNISFFCLGIWLLLSIKRRARKWSSVDICVLLYGISVLISAFFSPFSEICWKGYEDWYMGAISQLFFVGIYFFVSGYFAHAGWPLYLGEAAFFVITVIGLLNRLGCDVLGLYASYNSKDWEYSHMISTIGNINWFCGYASVILALPMAGYLYSKRKQKTIFLYGISVLGLVLLCIQGSDSGIVIAAVAIGICLVAGVRKPVFFQRGLLLLAGTLLGIFLMGHGINLFDAWEAAPADGLLRQNMMWHGFWILALICLGIYGIQKRLRPNTGKKFIRGFVLLGLLMTLTLAAVFVWKISQSDFASWGSGRGKLWSLAWEGFCRGNLKIKLIGAGPDCYAAYLQYLGLPPVITQEGRWGGAVFANAHNEWLNHLVNLGVLGTCCYLGIFMAGIKRYRGMLLGVLAIAMYGVHSLVSFQQVLNTPLFFAVLGLCEATYRKQAEQFI